MRRFFEKYGKQIIWWSVVLLCIILISATLILLLRYSYGLEEQAVSRVENYSADTTTLLTRKIDITNQKVHHAAERMASCTTQAELAFTIQEILEVSDYENLIDLRFFKGGTEYNSYAYPYEFNESDEVKAAVGRKGNGVIGVVYDYENNVQTIAFYATLENHPLIDTIVMFYPISSISDVFDMADEKKLSRAEFVALCSSEGEVLRVLHTQTGDLNHHNNIFEYVIYIRTNT